MTLYEIDRQIAECVDPETGEIADAEVLDALVMEREAKIESVALWIKNLRAEAAAIKAEKDILAARQKAAESKIESLTKYLDHALGGERFETAKCAVSFRKSTETRITDESKIPPEYFTETVSRKADKARIKEAIFSGVDIEGAEIVTKLNAQIR